MGSFPQISSALKGWQKSIKIAKVTQLTQNFKSTTVEQIINFKGVIQPLQLEELKIKPTEERSWTWLQIHTTKELPLQTNDRIKYRTTFYKIMARKDYSLNGYYEYHLVESYD
jgi:hypothetical protein